MQLSSLVEPKKIPKAVDLDINNIELIKEFSYVLLDTMVAHTGQGLAAVQIGIPFNLSVIDTRYNDRFRGNAVGLVNFAYKGIGEQHESLEGCLSLADQRFRVQRFERIRIMGYIFDFRDNILRKVENYFDRKMVILDDFQSIVIQHECQHAQGILINQIGKAV